LLCASPIIANPGDARPLLGKIPLKLACHGKAQEALTFLGVSIYEEERLESAVKGDCCHAPSMSTKSKNN
jgi:hypothetical protein